MQDPVALPVLLLVAVLVLELTNAVTWQFLEGELSTMRVEQEQTAVQKRTLVQVGSTTACTPSHREHGNHIFYADETQASDVA